MELSAFTTCNVIHVNKKYYISFFQTLRARRWLFIFFCSNAQILQMQSFLELTIQLFSLKCNLFLEKQDSKFTLHNYQSCHKTILYQNWYPVKIKWYAVLFMKMKTSGAHLTFDYNSVLPVDFHQLYRENTSALQFFEHLSLVQFHYANFFLTPISTALTAKPICAHPACPLVCFLRASRISEDKLSCYGFAGGSKEPNWPRIVPDGNPHATAPTAALPNAKCNIDLHLTATGSVKNSGCSPKRSKSFMYFRKEGFDTEWNSLS